MDNLVRAMWDGLCPPVSAIRIENGGKGYMNEKMIEMIVSDCGYEALGLYDYLYSKRNRKYNVTIKSMKQIANIGGYFDDTTLLESINDLKEFGYLHVVGKVYLFPKLVENYDNFFGLLDQITNIENKEDLDEILKSNDDVKSILLDFIQTNQNS